MSQEKKILFFLTYIYIGGVIHILGQTTCNSGIGRVLYERLPNQQLQGFDDDLFRDTAPPFRVLEKCQDLCLRDRAPSNNLVRTCTSFDFQPGSRIASFSGSPEYEESTCYLTREQAAPDGIGTLMLVPNSVHFTEICLSSSRPERECPSRRYVFERHPRSKLKLAITDIKEVTAINRTDCEDKCLSEFSFVCRSASYDTAMRICALSRFTRRTHPELLEDDPNSEYLENTCLNAERRCDGFAVFVKEENKRLGGPFEVDILNNITLEECQSMCLMVEKYFCRSVEYDDQTKQCILSEEDSISQKDDISISSSPTHHFYDLICLENQRGNDYLDNTVTSHLFSSGRRPDTAFQRYRNSRLSGEFHSEITGRSLSECLDECLRQTSFQCRSTVFSDRFRVCRLSRYSQKDGMRIIYDADYDYYENLMFNVDGVYKNDGNFPSKENNWRQTNRNKYDNRYPEDNYVPNKYDNRYPEDNYVPHKYDNRYPDNSYGPHKYDSRYPEDNYGPHKYDNRYPDDNYIPNKYDNRYPENNYMQHNFDRNYPPPMYAQNHNYGDETYNRYPPPEYFHQDDRIRYNFGSNKDINWQQIEPHQYEIHRPNPHDLIFEERLHNSKWIRTKSIRCQEPDYFKQISTKNRIHKQYVKKAVTVASLLQCQRLCIDIKDFVCRSISYRNELEFAGGESTQPNCEISDHNSNNLQTFKDNNYANYDYYERTRNLNDDECLDVTQTCSENAMIFTLRTPDGFFGRIYSYGFYDRCFVRGNGGRVNVLHLSGNLECGTQRYGDFLTNIVVVQYSDNVQTSQDRRYNLTCMLRGYGEAVVSSGYIGAGSGSPIAIEYLPAESTLSSKVRLMILYQNRPTTTIAVGDPLTFRIEALEGVSHMSDIFATNVMARDPYSGKSIQLIDRFGCPVDPYVFPELDKSRNGDILEARFNAFKIPESNFLVFEATVRNCHEECQPVYCPRLTGRSKSLHGRNKRDLLENNYNILQTLNDSNFRSLHPKKTDTINPLDDSVTIDQPEQVRGIIEVFDSRKEMERDPFARKLIDPDESLCIPTSEYRKLYAVVVLILILLTTITLAIGIAQRKHCTIFLRKLGFFETFRKTPSYETPANISVDVDYVNRATKIFNNEKNDLMFTRNQ